MTKQRSARSFLPAASSELVARARKQSGDESRSWVASKAIALLAAAALLVA